jgi:toxin CcdB
MAQFDVFRAPEGFGDIAFFLNVQSDLLNITETRVLVPLMASSVAPPQMGRLNPEITIKDRRYIAQFQDIQSHSTVAFGSPVDNLSQQRYEFVVAFDLLISGI